MESSLCAGLLMVSTVLALSEPGCDQTEFLHPNGSCVECLVCGPGEQLSEDCGFGDGGEGLCLACAEGQFSAETSLAPCLQCTQCNLLNRQERAPCSPTSDTHCGQCIRGYYELRSMSGEIELPCMPCHSSAGNIRKECLPYQSKHTTTAETKTVPISMVLIGSASGSSVFLLVLLIWAVLLTLERLDELNPEQVPRYWPERGGLFSGADPASPQCLLPSDPIETGERPREPSSSNPIETGERPPEQSTQTFSPREDLHRCLGSLSHENEGHPTSIVINVTTNVKPASHHDGEDRPWEELGGHHTLEEMEQNLLKICTVAQGQSLELLDYDTVQDLSLLLGPRGRAGGLGRLARSLGVPREVLANLQGFQDLFQYLRTSTYTLLPQLAQAAALLPRPDVVARIHRALAAKCTETT